MHEALIQVGSLLAEYRVLLLTAAIALGYAWALHLVVRGERYLVRTALFLLFVSALVLRFAAGRDYPPGMNEDEPKVLACALDALKDKRLHREGCSGIPILLNVLFQAQLVPILGPNRESMRFYPAVSGALSVIAVYGLARALRFTVSSALVSAALVTFLPWSLYYGRISFGAELTFHQLLLLWALARIVFANGGGREVIVAAFGQTLLFYDYFAGRLFFPFCVVALLLARGWRRLLVCVAAFLAVAAWLPYLLSEPQHLWAPRGQRPNLEIALVWEGVRAVFRSLVWPMAADGWITVRAAAVHPVVVLAAAAVGAVAVLRQPRIAAFLLGGFLLGIGPAVGTFPSAHRMIMAFPFVSLLAAYGLSQLPLSRWRAPLYALFLSIGGFASTCFFFSEEFWPANSRAASGAGITQLVESVPYPARRKVVVSPGLGYFAAVRTRTDPSDVVPLDTDNWWPPNAAEAIYLFSGHWEAL
ncbi:MAG: hypothetical protein KatS3mg077_1057 [Candidatus Binatia bacterium]|nr:MAG: hypothetical protein KatS3mg077_1057 [Candidatus Binatia bacterium]